MWGSQGGAYRAHLAVCTGRKAGVGDPVLGRGVMPKQSHAPTQAPFNPLSTRQSPSATCVAPYAIPALGGPATVLKILAVGLAIWNCRVGCAGLQHEQGAGLVE